MEQVGVLVIIAITCCLIAAIALSAKQKKPDEPSRVPNPVPVKASVKAPDKMPDTKTVTDVGSKTEQKPVPQYVSLYSWRIPQEKRICAHCDAENWPNAWVCEVCNEKLN